MKKLKNNKSGYSAADLNKKERGRFTIKNKQQIRFYVGQDQRKSAPNAEGEGKPRKLSVKMRYK